MQQPELGLKITALRKQKGLTQEELVDQCNINVRTLQRIENGEVSPRSYTVKMILSALDYDYESLQESHTTTNTGIGLIPPKEAKSIYSLLTMAWIAGILFLVAAIFEGITDYVRLDDGGIYIWYLGTCNHKGPGYSIQWTAIVRVLDSRECAQKPFDENFDHSDAFCVTLFLCV